jgi:glucose-specific phosphotransferase system IIA component
MSVVASPLTGRVVPLDDVADDVFAERVMGDGVALQPGHGEVRAPVAGVVAKLFRGGHAFVVQTDDGLEVLTHIGLDTVALEGEGFATHVAEDDRVAAGDLIVTVDLEHLGGKGVDLTSPVVVISPHTRRTVAGDDVETGAPLLEVEPRDD